MKTEKRMELIKGCFPGIVFKLKSKISQEVEETFNSDLILDNDELSFYTLKYLESELTKAIRSLNKAKNLFKKGNTSIELVQTYELNVLDIQAQIDTVKGN